MSMEFDDIAIGKRLFVGEGTPFSLGHGPAEIRGSAYIEGPLVLGSAPLFPFVSAATMIGPVTNSESPAPIIPGTIALFNRSPYSLSVVGDAAVFDNLTVNGQIEVGTNVIAQGEVIARVLGGQHILSLKKNFDIPHPSKADWRLRHTCPEGPSNDVYIRGRVTGENHINLPSYWKNFVDTTSITVNLTPVGAHQDVIIKRIDEKKIHLQSKGNMPIDCYYHIFAERKDGEKLISEYPGKTPEDYPGNNDEYSVVGYNYDKRR